MTKEERSRLGSIMRRPIIGRLAAIGLLCILGLMYVGLKIRAPRRTAELQFLIARVIEIIARNDK